MIQSSGIVQQIVRVPQLHLEYLDGAGKWTTDRDKAFVFKRHRDAEDRALALGGRPIFAMVVTAECPDPIERLPIDLEEQSRPRRQFRPRRRIPAAFANLPA